MRKYAYLFSIFLLLILSLFFVSCGKDGGPTTPTPILNAFKITDLKTFNCSLFNCPEIDCYIYAQYTNNTNSPVQLTGMLKFSATGSTNYLLFPFMFYYYELPAGPGASGQWRSEKEVILTGINHNAPHPDLYTIEVDVTANFSSGSITSTFFKDITIE